MPQKNYELVALISPELSEESAREFFANFQKEKIENLGGKITFEDFWGRRRLAYPIAKNDFANYLVIRFDFDGEKIAELDEEIRLEKNIIRHLITVPECDPMTAEEIAAWNRENLPEKPKSKKPVEKRAPRRRRESTPAAEKPAPKKMDKAKLDAELDAILDD